MEVKQEKFVELSSQTSAVKRLNPVSKHNRLIKADYIPEAGPSEKPGPTLMTDNSHIELKKDGDFVEMIKVNCVCGRSTQIVLDYDQSRAADQKTHHEEVER